MTTITKYLDAHPTVRSMIRVFAYTFLATLIPALLGFAADVQSWASGDDLAFPSITPLAKLVVSAVIGAIGAILSGVWNSLPGTKTAKYPDAIDTMATEVPEFP